MAETIAFIGLGNMGGPMASNLIAAGHSLVVFDLVEQAMQATADEGAAVADSAAAAAGKADIVISMLPAGKHVNDLYLGDGGLLAAVNDGTLLVDSSTSDAETSRKVAAAATERGLEMLDAPVSGGVGGAVSGGLTFMVGGPASGLERARPLLDIMGKNIFHAGDAGAGQIAKMCNNMMLAIQMIGTSEALNLAAANGLDPAAVSEIMKNASGGNWVLNVYNPYPGVMDSAPACNDYKPGFGVDLMLKDLGLAQDSSVANQVSNPMGSLARSLYATHSAAGQGHLDFSSIIRLLAGKNG